MKRGTLFILGSVILVGVLASLFWIYLKPDRPYRSAFSIVPEKAVFVIKSNNPVKGWDNIKKTSLWDYLTEHGIHKSVDENIQLFDSVAHKYPTFLKLLNNKELLIYAMLNKQNKPSYLYSLDLKKEKVASTIRKTFLTALQVSGANIAEFRQDSISYWKLDYSKEKPPVFLSHVNNLLIASYSKDIISETLSKQNMAYRSDKSRFEEVVSDDGLFSFYFNFKQLNSFYTSYFNESISFMEPLSDALNLASMEASVKNEQIILKGTTFISDSVSSFISTFSDVKPGKIQGMDVISKKAAIYISCTFNSFDDMLNRVKDNFAQADSALYRNTEKRLNNAGKILGVNIENEMFNWIGNEIAVIKLQGHSDIKADDIIIGIHAKDIHKAKKSLRIIEKKILEKVVRIKNISYHNHEIRYLNVKGFFQLFFGRYFEKIDKPFYTIIDDFVFFSNSNHCLSQLIDDYLRGNTLEREIEFADFANDFSEKSSFTIYFQMAKLYSILYYYSDEQQKKEIKKNREQLLGFSTLGMQLTADGDKFFTHIRCKHDSLVDYYYELENIERAAEETENLYYESLNFKPIIDSSYIKSEDSKGVVKYFHPEGTVLEEGEIRDEKPNGIWRSYYPNGRIKSIVIYKKGKVDGDAQFFYNNPKSSLKAEISFDKEEIDNVYREYYSSGTIKATIKYKNGKADGDATYYYENGTKKIEGKFNKGMRKGTWKHYTSHGELYDKQKWRKEKK